MGPHQSGPAFLPDLVLHRGLGSVVTPLDGASCGVRQVQPCSCPGKFRQRWETRDVQDQQQDRCGNGQWKRHPEALKDAAKAIGGAIDPVTADVAKIEDLERLIVEVRERHGRVDILFANTGIGVTRTSSSLQKPTL